MTEQERQMKKALVYTNLAYVLADVCDTYITETSTALRKAHSEKVLRFEEKKRFNEMQAMLQKASKKLKDIARPIYEIKDADSACTDSDWIADFLFLLVDRIGSSADQQTIIRSMIFNMKSNLNIY